MKHYIAHFGVPKKIRTDPGTVFVSEEFARFCRQFGIEHIICPVRDHRGNGKIERLIRTINERLRTKKQIIVTKDQSGLSEILYALRIGKKKDCSSPFEKQWGREPNTVKSNLVSKRLDISEQDLDLQFDNSDFQDELDSTVLVRERARGTKLQGAFDKKTGRKIKESAHTITLLPEGSKKPKTYAKRDLAAAISKQKEKFQKTNEPEKKKKKRAIIDSASESESTENKMEKKKKQKKKPRLTVEVQIDNEEEMRPPVIDLTASTSTEEEPNRNKKGEKKSIPDEKPEIVQNPGIASFPIKTTAKWEREEKPPEAAKRKSSYTHKEIRN